MGCDPTGPLVPSDGEGAAVARVRPLWAVESAEGAFPRRRLGETRVMRGEPAGVQLPCLRGPSAPAPGQPGGGPAPPSSAPDPSQAAGAHAQHSPCVLGPSQLLGIPRPGLRQSWKLRGHFTDEETEAACRSCPRTALVRTRAHPRRSVHGKGATWERVPAGSRICQPGSSPSDPGHLPSPPLGTWCMGPAEEREDVAPPEGRKW